MSREVGIAVVVVGIVVLLFGLLADVIGVGDENEFGSTQIAISIVGAVVAAAGGLLVLRNR